MDFTLRVVTIKVEAKVAFETPVTGYFFVRLEDGHEMVSVCFADIDLRQNCRHRGRKQLGATYVSRDQGFVCFGTNPL